MEPISSQQRRPPADPDEVFWEQSLKLSARNISTIATNIANADTPGYQAKALDFHTALAEVIKQTGAPHAAATTHGRHFQGPPTADAGSDPFVSFRPSTQPSIDGNTVDLDAERAAFSEATVRHQLALDRAIGEYTTMAKWIKGLT